MLVVDDELDLRESLVRLFARDGHSDTAVGDGQTAIERASATTFDVILLDVVLGPGPAGYDVCRTLRERGSVVPIIMLTALESEADAVLALESGADDYVRKPCGPTELRSRIRAVLRRASWHADGREVMRVGDLVLDRVRREVTKSGQPVALTFSEFELLSALASSPGCVFDRQELLCAMWGDSAYRDPRAIDVHVRNLRAKLEDELDRPRLILTVRGRGYRVRAE